MLSTYLNIKATLIQEGGDQDIMHTHKVKENSKKELEESSEGCCSHTACPGSLDPCYIVTYCTKWVKTSWRDSTEER